MGGRPARAGGGQTATSTARCLPACRLLTAAASPPLPCVCCRARGSGAATTREVQAAGYGGRRKQRQRRLLTFGGAAAAALTLHLVMWTLLAQSTADTGGLSSSLWAPLGACLAAPSRAILWQRPRRLAAAMGAVTLLGQQVEEQARRQAQLERQQSAHQLANISSRSSSRSCDRSTGPDADTATARPGTCGSQVAVAGGLMHQGPAAAALSSLMLVFYTLLYGSAAAAAGASLVLLRCKRRLARL